MAKFRTNHNRSSNQSAGMITKVGIFGLILGGLFMVFQKFTSNSPQPNDEVEYHDIPDLEEDREEDLAYLPTSSSNAIVKHQYYTLSYAEQYEQAEWVAYELTRERLNKEWVRRTNDFRPDNQVATGSATTDDYRRSGFDRGHLAAAGDMAFDELAMSESFFMSNMSPQDGGFNKGIWRELEELTRDWAKKFKHLYIVTGPVLSQPIKYRIGENQVAVPSAFYKVILDLSEPELKGIAYVIPNEVSDRPVHDFATNIDAVEALTGIDFFPDLLEERLEKEIEKEFDPSLWQTNQKKYDLRVTKWNKQ